ncbi:TetR/AcrR family transcriptional regulator [Jiangella gansuensis]|uniref:TetR/AcrR family transcriptional regulator n=1 Tax=Jiangella gansuensis TaxID=281473 RepID=UPI00047E15F6|nr:TetR/AcrR family transcriptional regulator [Jiangella gansuensis]
MDRARGRGAPKEPLILDAAREVFLRRGFGPAGVDEIAAVAGISKVTLYKYFAGKEQLFLAVIRRDIETAERMSDDHLEVLASTTDLDRDLRAFAKEFVTTVTDPQLLRMRRIVAAEAERFPEVARAWDERARVRGQQTLARLFAALAQRRLLDGDMSVAAEQFLWLLLGAPFNTALFDPARVPFDDRELTAHADAAVRTFLAAYRAGGNRAEAPR